mmetsp:Transcript_71835/g.206227  ORF Transcript_71835/g.206227 Transcript_71835/m.206227 type:complete len:225 (+) Transcript_71835:109-783(+)
MRPQGFLHGMWEKMMAQGSQGSHHGQSPQATAQGVSLLLGLGKLLGSALEFCLHGVERRLITRAVIVGGIACRAAVFGTGGCLCDRPHGPNGALVELRDAHSLLFQAVPLLEQARIGIHHPLQHRLPLMLLLLTVAVHRIDLLRQAIPLLHDLGRGRLDLGHVSLVLRRGRGRRERGHLQIVQATFHEQKVFNQLCLLLVRMMRVGLEGILLAVQHIDIGTQSA